MVIIHLSGVLGDYSWLSGQQEFPSVSKSRDCSELGAPSGEGFLFCCVCVSLDKLLAAVGTLCSDFKDLVV